MSTRSRFNSAYGLSQALLGVPQYPVVSKRAPLPNDYAEIGTFWIDTVANQVYVLSSIAANVSNWINVAGGGGNFNAVDVNPGDLTVDLGNINVLAGNISALIGDITSATLTATIGDITCVSGNVVVTAGAVDSNNGFTSVGGIVSVGGSIAGSSLLLSGDSGPVPGTPLAISSVTDATVSTGVMVINSTTVNPGANTGFIKCYLGATPVWIPYFDDIAP